MSHAAATVFCRQIHPQIAKLAEALAQFEAWRLIIFLNLASDLREFALCELTYRILKSALLFGEREVHRKILLLVCRRLSVGQAWGGLQGGKTRGRRVWASRMVSLI